MPINLTTLFVIPNGTRLLIEDARPNDKEGAMQIDVELRSAGGSNLIYSRQTIYVRNGATPAGASTDRIVRGALPSGATIDTALIAERNALTLATGYDDAVTAWRGGANAGGRRNALEAWCLQSGVFHSSLAGA